MYSLKLSGFKSKAQVEEFLSWYGGQGEQDAWIWFENAKDEGRIDVETMNVDSSVPEVWDGDTLNASVQVS